MIVFYKPHYDELPYHRYYRESLKLKSCMLKGYCRQNIVRTLFSILLQLRTYVILTLSHLRYYGLGLKLKIRILNSKLNFTIPGAIQAVRFHRCRRFRLIPLFMHCFWLLKISRMSSLHPVCCCLPLSYFVFANFVLFFFRISVTVCR